MLFVLSFNDFHFHSRNKKILLKTKWKNVINFNKKKLLFVLFWLVILSNMSSRYVAIIWNNWNQKVENWRIVKWKMTTTIATMRVLKSDFYWCQLLSCVFCGKNHQTIHDFLWSQYWYFSFLWSLSFIQSVTLMF